MAKEPAMCKECNGGLGVGYFIHGSVPPHKSSADHWRIVREHSAAKDILKATVDLIGAEATIRFVARMGHGDATEANLKKLFKELAL